MKVHGQVELNTLLSSNSVILECGSNDGKTTLSFLKDHPQVRVFCFEPDPRNIIKFKTNVRRFDNRCTLYEVALTDKDVPVLLHQSSGRASKHPQDYVHTDSNTIKDPKPHMKIHPWLRFDNTIQVEGMRLDTWLSSVDIPLIDFMWADVEGAEENLITGGLKVFERLHYCYTEYSDHENYGGRITSYEILKLLPDFELVHKWANDMLLHNKKWNVR